MKPLFEEKTFESYFNNELDRRASIYFPLGQVQEGGIGADASGFSKSRYLWRKLGHPFWFNLPFEGIDLSEIAVEMEHYLGREIKNIPRIKTNILFQYKRSALVTTKNSKSWKYWGQDHFKYDIYKEQQSMLAHISSVFGKKALVLYAAPAIDGVNDLIKFKQKNSIIENTNFRPASELNGHHKNTYIEAGNKSYACSEPEIFENFDLLDKLEHMQASEYIDPKNNIIEFSKNILVNSEKFSFNDAFQSELRIYREYGLNESSLFYSLLAMAKFKEISGIQWLIATEKA